MFSLEVERGRFLAVCGDVDKNELIDIYQTPIDDELYEGRVIEVLELSGYCRAEVGDSYEKIAKRYNCDLQRLIKINQNGVIYPSKRVWLP